MSSSTKSKTRKAAAAPQRFEGVTASSLAARLPAWLQSPELEVAIAETREHVRDLTDADTSELRALTKQRLRQEIDFIGNERFRSAREGKRIFSAELGLAERQTALGIAAIRRSGVDLPIHLGRLCEAPLLTPEQERLLFERMNYLLQQAAIHRSVLNPERPSRQRLELIELYVALADWHRDRIVEANLRLVFSIVKKFVNANNSFDELLSDGIIALIRGVEKFDFDRGFRFSTYATQVVRRNAYRTVVTRQQERQKVVGGLQDMDIDIGEEERTSAISETRWHELRSRLSVMLGDLDRREKFIIRARFSLGSHRRVHTLQSLADRLGVSKERVRQLERRAMDKLRAMAGTTDLAELEN
ncbi:sigma-70 family RNA polymerase sigma factor [Aporhodopirellula aestuarii]|uniref:Sigma-70 family RNA polymerase sigma factor n=1 Tax=Aporhodopirellula aestuarii TaxID=2950107 RepID=A0ABT0U5U8_9BACT|nr:sigma-70 family RNA polymerase sigma factor [Aporhodopirellula aestuarii]MCM2372255.1 sigma-70 family RNA polymerase sigma factor [Aporhodopirellula aestuarii]